MRKPDTFLEDIQQVLLGFLEQKRQQFVGIATDTVMLVDRAQAFVAGGKRLRPQCCLLGWQAVAEYWSPSMASADRYRAWQTLTTMGAALELFQAAALVHDDLIDHSDVRRGHPSAHRQFEALHQQRAWSMDGAEFGRSSALLLGDLLLTWSHDVMTSALEHCDAKTRSGVNTIFHTMASEVMAGQYLDLVSEHSWRDHDFTAEVSRSETINRFKSAKYTVEHPLLMGAVLAGANRNQLAGLAEFGVNIGEAFQLRDDVLGVFGDPEVTGKPAGDDLREGKRTLLVLLAEHRAAPNVRTTMRELVGDPTLDAHQIRMLQDVIATTGALAEIEATITRLREQALTTLHQTPLERSHREHLAELALTLTERTA